MRAYLLPFGDLVAYALMPNHFHWLFHVENVTVERIHHRQHVDRVEYLRRLAKYGAKAKPVERAHTRYAAEREGITLNESIGLLQQSYSKSINKEKGWSGSLFRRECKAKDGWIDKFVTLKQNEADLDTRFLAGTDYKYHCLRYIHNNPVEGDLVGSPEEWLFSSARDYAGLRNGTICKLELGREIINFI
jgi:putative transposase